MTKRHLEPLDVWTDQQEAWKPENKENEKQTRYTSEIDPNEIEICDLPSRDFKRIGIKMLTEVRG